MMALLLAALLALTPAQTAQDTANIEGRVLRAGSQEPIPNVQVALIKSGAGGTAMTPETAAALDSLQQLVSMAPRRISRAFLDSLVATREQELGLAPGTLAATSQTTTLTDAAGHFSFKNQTPGTYGIRASLDGYFGVPVNGSAPPTVTKSVTVESQKPIAPTDIFMVKGGIITGRLRDPKGQPASGVTIGAARANYSNGCPQWAGAIFKPADDRGVFRLFGVAPGEYYVSVSPRVATADPGPQDSWAGTFFPGVAELTAATPVVVGDGREIEGVDFSIQTLASAPTTTYKIRGKVTNPLAEPNPTTGAVDRNVNTFMLASREPKTPGCESLSTVENSISAEARRDGEFEIRDVRPGSYDLFVYYMSVPPVATPAAPPPLRRYYIDRTRVDIRNSDAEGVTLQIQKGTEIRGKVVSQGTTSVPPDKIKINLRPLDTMPVAFAAIVGTISVDATGNFSAPDIAAARYSLQVTGLPETAYVADIRQGGTTIFNAGFLVGNQPGAPLEIIVNASGGTIAGNVQTAERKPAGSSTVVLVPPASDRQNAMRYKTAQTDDKGNFTIKGVPPGEYTLFAWESVPNTAWMNSDFLEKYQNRGRAVVVSQGTRLEAQLELIPDEINKR